MGSTGNCDGWLIYFAIRTFSLLGADRDSIGPVTKLSRYLALRMDMSQAGVDC